MPFARALKDASGLPVAAVGLITDAQQAENILEAGDADAVMIGRAALRNAEWAIDALEELGVDHAKLPYPDSYFRAY